MHEPDQRDALRTARTQRTALAFPLPLLQSFSKATPVKWPSCCCYSGFLKVEFGYPDLAMGGRRSEINTNKCGTHPTPSKPYYVDTDTQKAVHCQVNCKPARDCNTGSYSVKHHYPSPIVSWIEDLSSFGNVSFSPEPEYPDGQSRSSVGQSSASVNLHDMQISVRLTDEFIELAKENTSSNVETCGILGASFREGTYYVTTLIIPKQEATAHSCQAVNEEEIHAILSEQSLYPAGWIHTHPSQTCFLSSIDLHTQYSYQVMLPEAVAIVIAPTDPNRQELWNIQADRPRRNGESGFHAHRETTDGGPIYETCSKVMFNPNLRFEVVDLRSAP
uniref:MPN domain-containing protein n=1 Tax=Leersia perrieri TaxID=77586 RepID=A0A0D9V3S3_9ORYZ